MVTDVRSVRRTIAQIPAQYQKHMSPGIMQQRHAHSWDKEHPKIAATLTNRRTLALPIIADLLGAPTSLAELKTQFVHASFECSVEAAVEERAHGMAEAVGSASGMLRHYDRFEAELLNEGRKNIGDLTSFMAIALRLSGFNRAEDLRDHEVALASLLADLAIVTDFKMEVVDGPETDKFLYLEMPMAQEDKINHFVMDLLVAAEQATENTSEEVDKRYEEGDYY